jgi:hypothetical protein
MPSYLIETYLAHDAAGERQARERRASSAAEELTRQGTRIRFRGSIHVPEDELCYFTFETPSRRDAALVAERAGLEPLRVVQAVSSIPDVTSLTSPSETGEPRCEKACEQ